MAKEKTIEVTIKISRSDIEAAAKRLRKDASICRNIQSKEYYSPEALESVADMLDNIASSLG